MRTKKPQHFFSLRDKRTVSTTGDGSAGSGLLSLAWTQNVAKGIAIEIGDIGAIAKNIHYPECWDTMAYPTLADAVCEITHCDPKQCSHPSNASAQPRGD